VEPSERNGLRSTSRLMVDQNNHRPEVQGGRVDRRLEDEDIVRLNQAGLVFLGLAVSPKTGRIGK
jgi:mRNA interferase MazF